jgi:Leucine-rich repeat (LRR) protein
MGVRVEAKDFTMVDLSECLLPSLPPFVQHLESLITLNISKNAIRSLDSAAFGRLLSLEIIDVSNNLLSELPVDTLLRLPLKSLVCYYNADLDMPCHDVSCLGGGAVVEYLRGMQRKSSHLQPENTRQDSPGHVATLLLLKDKYSPWKKMRLMESFKHGFAEPRYARTSVGLFCV